MILHRPNMYVLLFLLSLPPEYPTGPYSVPLPTRLDLSAQAGLPGKYPPAFSQLSTNYPLTKCLLNTHPQAQLGEQTTLPCTAHPSTGSFPRPDTPVSPHRPGSPAGGRLGSLSWCPQSPAQKGTGTRQTLDKTTVVTAGFSGELTLCIFL